MEKARRCNVLKNDSEILGENIRLRRKALRKSQEQVAEDMDISVSTYRRIEQGDANPELNTLSKIAEYFETDLGSLWSGKYSHPVKDMQSTEEPGINQILSKANLIKGGTKRKRVLDVVGNIIDIALE
jgi:transcriptional regulator with XRE-family HTH domain